MKYDKNEVMFLFFINEQIEKRYINSLDSSALKIKYKTTERGQAIISQPGKSRKIKKK